VVRRYLATQSTSVASEHVFSSAGELLSDRRARTTPDTAQTLLLIKYYASRFQQ
jgi:hAT family C-terminal dimerisation region